MYPFVASVKHRKRPLGILSLEYPQTLYSLNSISINVFYFFNLDLVVAIPTVTEHMEYLTTEWTLLERVDDVPSKFVLKSPDKFLP